MTRGFTGLRTGQAKYSASKAFLEKNKKGGGGSARMTPEERYQAAVESKMKEIQGHVDKQQKYSVMLPGTEKTSNKREMSKSAKQVVEKLAKEKAKKMAKKLDRRNIKIVAKFFTGPQGGRIDKEGRIYGPDGRRIGYVCKKSGFVKREGTIGGRVCKYKGSSTFCEYQITRWIAELYDKRRRRNSIYGSYGHARAGGGVWENGRDNGDTRGFWGGSGPKDITGGFWGGSGGDSGGVGSAPKGFWN